MSQTLICRPVYDLQPLRDFGSLGLFHDPTLLEKKRFGGLSWIGHPKNGFWSDAKLTAGTFISQWLHCWFGPNLFNPSRSHPPVWEKRGLPFINGLHSTSWLWGPWGIKLTFSIKIKIQIKMEMKQIETPKLDRQNEGTQSFHAKKPLYFLWWKWGHTLFKRVN